MMTEKHELRTREPPEPNETALPTAARMRDRQVDELTVAGNDGQVPGPRRTRLRQRIRASDPMISVRRGSVRRSASMRCLSDTIARRSVATWPL